MTLSLTPVDTEPEGKPDCFEPEYQQLVDRRRPARGEAIESTDHPTISTNTQQDAAQTAPRPTIIIVPGAWHFGTKHFTPLTERLQTVGYKVIPLDLPSISDDPPLTGWQDDITHIAQTIEQAADRGEDVVLVMHSRGGHCGSDAAQGLSKTDREKAGKKGGIVRCVFLAAFAAPEGLSIWFATQGPDDWQDVKHTVCRPTRVGEIFYNDCTPQQIDAAAREIRPQSTLCFLLPLTYAAWKSIPSTYLVCERDSALPVAAQEAMVAQPGAEFTVERCAAGHSPFLSMPDFTAEVVRRAAGERI